MLTDSRSQLHNYISNTLSASESATLTLTDSRSWSRFVIVRLNAVIFFHLSHCSQTHAHAYTITSPTQCTITLILMLMPGHRYIKCCYFFHLGQCSQTHGHGYTITSPTHCQHQSQQHSRSHSRSRSRLVIGRLNAVIFFHLSPVSYTHLTLPTNREV